MYTLLSDALAGVIHAVAATTVAKMKQGSAKEFLRLIMIKEKLLDNLTGGSKFVSYRYCAVCVDPVNFVYERWKR